MSTLTSFLIGSLIFLVVGAFLEAYLVYKFNPEDITYIIDKLRAKKGGSIDVTQHNATDVKPEKKEKRKLFNFKHKRRTKK